jgi:hypothetical protein
MKLQPDIGRLYWELNTILIIEDARVRKDAFKALFNLLDEDEREILRQLADTLNEVVE